MPQWEQFVLRGRLAKSLFHDLLVDITNLLMLVKFSNFPVSRYSVISLTEYHTPGCLVRASGEDDPHEELITEPIFLLSFHLPVHRLPQGDTKQLVDHVQDQHSVTYSSVSRQLVDPCHELGVRLVWEEREQLAHNLDERINKISTLIVYCRWALLRVYAYKEGDMCLKAMCAY